jgi:hypothetical protein
MTDHVAGHDDIGLTVLPDDLAGDLLCEESPQRGHAGRACLVGEVGRIDAQDSVSAAAQLAQEQAVVAGDLDKERVGRSRVPRGRRRRELLGVGVRGLR